MKRIVILKGLPGSGKSTLAKEFLAQEPPHTWVRVNKDSIRHMFLCEWGKGIEKLVCNLWEQAIRLALLQGKSVIVDDCNLNPVHEEKIREIAKDFKNVLIRCWCVNTPLDKCIKRDYERGELVGEVAIREMYNRWKPDNDWLRSTNESNNRGE